MESHFSTAQMQLKKHSSINVQNRFCSLILLFYPLRLHSTISPYAGLNNLGITLSCVRWMQEVDVK